MRIRFGPVTNGLRNSPTGSKGRYNEALATRLVIASTGAMLPVGHEAPCRLAALACRIESPNHIGKVENSRQVSGTSDASKTQLGLIRIYSIPLLLTADSSDEDWDQNWGDKRSENRSKHHRDSCSSALHLSLDYRLGRALPV